MLEPTIAATFAVLVGALLERPGRGGRIAGVALLVLLLAFNAHSLVRYLGVGDGTYSGQEYGPFLHGATADGCLALLEEEGVDGLAGDHWMRHAIAFLSADRIVPSPARYGPHVERFRQAACIAWSSYRGSPDARWMDPLLDHLADTGVRFDACEVDGQRFAILRETGLPARDWAADSGSSPSQAPKAIDRDPRTNWKAYERPLDAVDPPDLTVDLGGVNTLRRLGFVFSHLRPHHVGLLTSRDGRVWSPVRILAPEADDWSTPLPAIEARWVRLVAVAPDDMHWELVELFVFEDD